MPFYTPQEIYRKIRTLFYRVKILEIGGASPEVITEAVNTYLGSHPVEATTNAADLTSGTLSSARLAADVTKAGNTFNGNSQLVKTTSDGKLPALDGSLLTGISGTGGGISGPITSEDITDFAEAVKVNSPGVDFPSTDFNITGTTDKSITIKESRIQSIVNAMNLGSGSSAADIINILTANGFTVTPPAPISMLIDNAANTATIVPPVGYNMTTLETSIDNGTSYQATPTGVRNVGNIAIPIGEFKARVAAGTNRNAGAVLSSTIAFTANTTPVAPTLIEDDTLNTIDATHPLGNSEILISVNGSAYAQFDGAPISVNNIARPAGYFKFKTKAAPNRNESPVAESSEFTVVSTGGGGVKNFGILSVENSSTNFGATNIQVNEDGDLVAADGERGIFKGSIIDTGVYQFDIVQTNEDMAVGLGYSTSSNGIGDYEYGLSLHPSGVYLTMSSGGNQVNLGAMISGEKARFNVVSDGTTRTVKLQRSADGSVWTDLYTYPTPVTGKLKRKFEFRSSTTLHQPTGDHLTSEVKTGLTVKSSTGVTNTSGVFTPDSQDNQFGHVIKFNETIPAGKDGYFEMSVDNSINNGVSFGISSTGEVADTLHVVLWENNLVATAYEAGTNGAVATSYQFMNGDKVRISVEGNTVVFKRFRVTQSKEILEGTYSVPAPSGVKYLTANMKGIDTPKLTLSDLRVNVTYLPSDEVEEPTEGTVYTQNFNAPSLPTGWTFNSQTGLTDSGYNNTRALTHISGGNLQAIYDTPAVTDTTTLKVKYQHFSNDTYTYFQQRLSGTVDTPDFYAFGFELYSNNGQGGLYLFKRYNGVSTVLGGGAGANILPSVLLGEHWYEIEYTVTGTTSVHLTVVFKRLTDNLYLNSSNQWVSEKVNVFDVIDTTNLITALGKIRIESYSGITDANRFDDFEVIDGIGTAPTNNLLASPNDFTTSSWTRTNVTNPSPNVIAGDGTNSKHEVTQLLTKSAVAKSYRLEVEALAHDLTYLLIGVEDNTGNGFYQNYNILDGNIAGGEVYGSGFTLNTKTITPTSGGYFKVTATFTSNNATTLLVFTSLIGAGQSGIWTANNTNYVNIKNLSLTEI
jgi:hypothetical protein